MAWQCGQGYLPPLPLEAWTSSRQLWQNVWLHDSIRGARASDNEKGLLHRLHLCDSMAPTAGAGAGARTGISGGAEGWTAANVVVGPEEGAEARRSMIVRFCGRCTGSFT